MVKMKNSGIEWIGEIPEDWKLELFKNILWERSEKNFPIKSKERLSLSIDKGVTLYSEKTTNLDRFKEDFEEYKLTYEGDLVMNSMNVISGAVGISKYFGCVSPAYYTYYDKDSEHYLARYCDYIFKCQTLRRLLFALGKGIMAIDRGNGRVNTCRLKVAREDLGRLRLPYPKYEIIKNIVNILDSKCSTIDSLKSDIQKQIETLEQYKKSVITEAVTKGINPNAKMKDSGIEWIGEIPEHWEIKHIGQIYVERRQKVNDRDYPPLSVTMKGIVPQLETAAKSDAHDDRKLVCKGDFAINSRSDRRGSCGISPCDGSISLINTVLIPLGKMNPDFYNWLFHTPIFADEFYKNGHGIVDDLWTTSWQEMKHIAIQIPPISEQKEIATYLNDKCKKIDNIIESKKQQLEILEEYKKSLIFEYVTGKKECY